MVEDVGGLAKGPKGLRTLGDGQLAYGGHPLYRSMSHLLMLITILMATSHPNSAI